MRKRRVRVHFVDRRTTIEGIQVSRTRSDMVLDAAVLKGEDADNPLIGRTAIPRSQILFYQVLS